MLSPKCVCALRSSMHQAIGFVCTKRIFRGNPILFFQISLCALRECGCVRCIYYDPGIKIENVSSGWPVIKKRNQFRIRLASIALPYLYCGLAQRNMPLRFVRVQILRDKVEIQHSTRLNPSIKAKTPVPEPFHGNEQAIRFVDLDVLL